MSFFSLWLLPALLGALIGYFTNWLAIKMLFRPFREIRVLGIRLPFTPGILPKERSRLARSIGETVSAELITEEVVKRRLSDPDLRSALVRGVDERLDGLLSSPAAGFIPSERGTGGALAEFLGRAWSSALSSQAFRDAVASAASAGLKEAEGLPLSRLLPPERARELASLLLSPANVERLRARASAYLDEVYGASSAGADAEPDPAVERADSRIGHADAERAPGIEFLIPAQALEPILAALAEGLYGAALPALESFISGAETRKGLERYAMEIVRRAIGRLNPLQRLIVSAAQYDRSLAETMPDAVEDMVRAAKALLRDPAMPGRAARAAVSAFEKASGEGFAATLRRIVAAETARAALSSCVDALASRGPEAAERAAALAAARSSLSLSSIIGATGFPAEELARRTAEGVAGILSGEGEGGRLLGAALEAFRGSLAAGLGERSLGSFLGADGEIRARLAAELADKGLALLASEAGRIVAGFDIRRIVVERIDELDMAHVERIVLSVVDRELLWITILGGILGGLIGFAQSLVLRFGFLVGR